MSVRSFKLTMIFVWILFACNQGTGNTGRILPVKQYKNGEVVRIPFELYEDWIFIKVSINGSKPLNYIFDTGVNVMTVDEKTAEGLGLIHKGNSQLSGSIQQTGISFSTAPNVAIGSITLDSVIVVTQSHEHISVFYDRDIHGFIGYDLLAGRIIRIDYENNVLEVLPAFKPPEGSYVTGLTFINDIPMISGLAVICNGDTAGLRLIFDTGASVSLVCSSPFTGKYHLTETCSNRYESPALGPTAVGKIYVTRFPELNVANHSFSDIPVSLNTSSSGLLSWDAHDGLLGNEILKRFNLIIDRNSKLVCMTPNSLMNEDFKIHCSGLFIKYEDLTRKCIIVHAVVEGSPADESGLLPGDELLKINGRKCSEMRISEIKALLRKDGEKVILCIKRQDILIDMLLKLKEII
ncbi:MAG: aspartyl protease family protein [Bacteroidetes bacterium]|nr:aspartyl protease family protein [Bacteroidota bacterium]